MEDTLVEEQASVNSVIQIGRVPPVVNEAVLDPGSNEVPNFEGARTSSPANSQARKSENIGSRFKRNRQKNYLGLTNLEQGEEVHSESFLSSAKRIDAELSKLNIEKIIGLCDNDLELNEVYGGTVDSIIYWE